MELKQKEKTICEKRGYHDFDIDVGELNDMEISVNVFCKDCEAYVNDNMYLMFPNENE